MNPASKPISKPDPPAKPDLWQRAFDALESEKQQLIKSVSIAKSDKIIDPNGVDVKVGVVDRLNILNGVVDTVKTQYEIDQAKSKIREPAQKIITSVLGFQDLIQAAVGFDPTGHATSAWAIVSLGLNVVISPPFMKSQLLIKMIFRRHKTIALKEWLGWSPPPFLQMFSPGIAW